MTVTPTPRHIATLEEAEECGEKSGRQFASVAAQTCHPSLWTQERRDQWVKLLGYIRTNPYLEGDDENTLAYAQRWQLAFDKGCHAQQAENRRKNA